MVAEPAGEVKRRRPPRFFHDYFVTTFLRFAHLGARMSSEIAAPYRAAGNTRLRPNSVARDRLLRSDTSGLSLCGWSAVGPGQKRALACKQERLSKEPSSELQP